MAGYGPRSWPAFAPSDPRSMNQFSDGNDYADTPAVPMARYAGRPTFDVPTLISAARLPEEDGQAGPPHPLANVKFLTGFAPATNPLAAAHASVGKENLLRPRGVRVPLRRPVRAVARTATR